MSSSSAAASYNLKAAKPDHTRKYEALKFRERVPELESNQSQVRIERRGRMVASEEKFVVETKKRKYEGSHEVVGASSQAASCYVALRVQDNVMTMMPLGDWYSFRPAVTHKTIGLDDAEEMAARLRREAATAAPPEAVKKEERAGGGDRKRPLPSSSSAEGKPDRAKMAKVAEAAAARGGGATAVDERDLVMLLHSRGKMPLKEVIQHFKAFMPTKEEKQAFLKMVPRVATLAAEEGSGGKQVAKLKDSTLAEYKLD